MAGMAVDVLANMTTRDAKGSPRKVCFHGDTYHHGGLANH